MIAQDVLRVVASAGVIASIIPVAVGVFRFRPRLRELKILWAWLGLGVVSNFAMTISGVRAVQNSGIAQVGYLVLGLLGLYAIGELVPAVDLRRWVYLAMALYAPIWVWRHAAGEATEPFSRVAGPVLWVLLTCAAALLVGSRLRHVNVVPHRDPGILTGFAMMVSYAPSAALEPVSFELYGRDPELTTWLYVARGVLLVIGAVLFTLVFMWTTPPRFSSGSSSSVA